VCRNAPECSEIPNKTLVFLLHTVSSCSSEAHAFRETNRDTIFAAKILYPYRGKISFYYRALNAYGK
jgi:hypothetical protein